MPIHVNISSEKTREEQTIQNWRIFFSSDNNDVILLLHAESFKKKIICLKRGAEEEPVVF